MATTNKRSILDVATVSHKTWTLLEKMMIMYERGKTKVRIPHIHRNVVCCVGDFKGKTVHTFVMCAHFADVRILH